MVVPFRRCEIACGACMTGGGHPVAIACRVLLQQLQRLPGGPRLAVRRTGQAFERRRAKPVQSVERVLRPCRRDVQPRGVLCQRCSHQRHDRARMRIALLLRQPLQFFGHGGRFGVAAALCQHQAGGEQGFAPHDG